MDYTKEVYDQSPVGAMLLYNSEKKETVILTTVLDYQPITETKAAR
jgi:hypothetical protein